MHTLYQIAQGRKSFLIIIIIWLAMAPQAASAQYSKAARDSINALNQVDHQAMMEQLGINELRPGPSGNPDASNAANTDESKAKTYDVLPDPLVFEDGRAVNNPEDWVKRKEEIRELFDREIYGRLPDNIPEVNWKVTQTIDTVIGSIAATQKRLSGVVDNSTFPELSVTIDMTVTTPSAVDGPVPLIMTFTFNLPASWTNRRPPSKYTDWREQMLAHGWGYATLIPTSFQADNGAGLRQGIIGLTNKGASRQPDDWGALRAWAWGASRAMDYFETDHAVDEKRVGIAGLSRYGKAALVAMAYEPRLAIGLIGSSGAGGAKLLRRNIGEQVENLASSYEYHWFAGNFIKYAGPLSANDLPVDAHQLIAMCAPIPVFIGAGAPQREGYWVDARGTFMAGVEAGPVYELLGHKGLSKTSYPSEGEFLSDGDIAFRQHEGGHTNGPNWSFFIKFADKYFTNK